MNELQNEICTFLAKGFVESRPSEGAILYANEYFIKLKKYAKDVFAQLKWLKWNSFEVFYQ